MTETESHPSDWTPRPDPTVLTTAALLREVNHLREETNLTIQSIRVELRGMHELLDERYVTQTKALDAAFVAAEKAVSTALDSAEKAVSKAEIATERRFESVNEFRGQLADQAGTFLARAEADVRLKALADRIGRLDQIVGTLVSNTEYAAAHEALRQSMDVQRDTLSEYKTSSISAQAKLQGEISNMKSRYAGVSIALGVIMSILIVLITVVELTKK